MERKFFDKFFPSWKTKEIRGKIATFVEEEGEPFHEAWGRFKLLLAQCPHHEFTLVSRIQSFYDGLLGLTQAIVDNACGGAMREKTAEEVLEKYEMLGQNSQQRSSWGQDMEGRKNSEIAKQFRATTTTTTTTKTSTTKTTTTTTTTTLPTSHRLPTMRAKWPLDGHVSWSEPGIS